MAEENWISIGSIKGDKGDTGSGLKILGFFITLDELKAAVPNPNVGDAYCVGREKPYDIYIYSANKGWVDNGALSPDINEQVPNYAEAATLAELTSGEKISLAFGKIKKAIKELISHIGNKNNPHNTTADAVGALSKTIDIENTDILNITTDGWYYGRLMTNVPTKNNAGYIRVMVYSINYRVVSWRPHDSLKEYVNVLNGGTWLGWTEVFTSKGGTLTEQLTFTNNDSFQVLEKIRTISGVDHQITIGVSSDGASTFEHSTADTLDGRLELSNVAGNPNALVLRENSSTSAFAIFGEHNKPKKDYTGSGSTAQTVDIGGVGNAVIVISQGGYGGFITPSGAFMFVWINGTENNFQTTTNATYKNGKLTFAGESWLNTSGVTYTAYVI